MPGPFLHVPQQVVAQLLVDRALATDPAWWRQGSRSEVDNANRAHDWPAFWSTEPDVPDLCVTVYRSADQQDARILSTGESVRHFGIQIKVRGRTDADADLKAELLHDDLTKRAYDQQVNLTDPVASYLVQSFPVVRVTPAYRSAPGSDRWACSLNCLAVILKYPIQG